VEQTIDTSAPVAWQPDARRGFGYSMGRLWTTWRRKPTGVLGALIIIAVIVVAIAAPKIAPFDPKEFAGPRLAHPGGKYLIGTNNLGQDVLSRTIYGAQISIAAGVTTAIIAVGIGTFLGIISGYFGGFIDLTLQRALEVLASFPALVLVLMIVSVLGRPGSSSKNLFVIAYQLGPLEIAIAVGSIFGIMRVIRSAVMKERDLPYIEAARSLGATPPRILWRHVLPNVLPYVIVAFSTIIGSVILIEASLSFLGYGVQSGTPSWGIDLSSRNREYFLAAPWLMVGPGVALSLTVLGYNFLGDALRDILDPRLRGSR